MRKNILADHKNGRIIREEPPFGNIYHYESPRDPGARGEQGSEIALRFRRWYPVRCLEAAR